MSCPDSLCQKVSLQQRRASKVPLAFGGRSQEDTGKPTGLQRSCLTSSYSYRSGFGFVGSRLFDSAACCALQCLPDPNNYHEFCRLLARLKSNYQLGELVKVENYPEVIRLIANFTVTSLQVSTDCFESSLLDS